MRHREKYRGSEHRSHEVVGTAERAVAKVDKRGFEFLFQGHCGFEGFGKLFGGIDGGNDFYHIRSTLFHGEQVFNNLFNVACALHAGIYDHMRSICVYLVDQ